MIRIPVTTTVTLLGLALAVVGPRPADATGLHSHSGTIVAVEPDRGSLTIEEMGPWTGRVESSVRRLTISLGSGVEVSLLERSPQAVGEHGWPGGFVERPIAASTLQPGDYVTVEGRPGGHALVVADSIRVVRPERG